MFYASDWQLTFEAQVESDAPELSQLMRKQAQGMRGELGRLCRRMEVMTATSTPCAIDHYLIARVEGCVTGKSAHDMHNLIAIYEGLCFLSATDGTARARIPAVEARLRQFYHARIAGAGQRKPSFQPGADHASWATRRPAAGHPAGSHAPNGWE